jgi:tetratricopeptide (TPR) repeat protein
MRRAILLAAALWLAMAVPAVAADPFDPVLVMLEAQAALAKGDLEGASAIYGRGLDHPAASDRYRVSYYMGRSRVRARQQRLDLALADVDAAVTLADRSEPAVARGNIHAMRGLLLAEVGRPAEAIAALETAHALLQSPDDEYADLLAEMKKRQPEQVDALRRQTESLIRTVKQALDRLRQAGGRR